MKPSMSFAQPDRRTDAGSIDPGHSLLLATVVLIGLGVVMSYSATAALTLDGASRPLLRSPARARRSALAAAASRSCCPGPDLATARAAACGWSACVAVALTLMVGIEVNGAQRWLALPGSASDSNR